MKLSDIPAGTVLFINSKVEDNEINCHAIGPFEGGLLVTTPTSKDIPPESIKNFNISYTDSNNNLIELDCTDLRPVDILKGHFYLIEGVQGVDPPRPKRRSERHVVATFGKVTTDQGEIRNVMIYDISMNGMSFIDPGGHQYYKGQHLTFSFTSRNLKMHVASAAEVTRHFSMNDNSAIGCRIISPSMEMINYIFNVRKLRAEKNKNK